MIIKNKFYHPKTIERKANELLADFYKSGINKIAPPVEIDKILELHLNLNVLWESFNDSSILAGLIPNDKTVVFNDDLREEFDKNKGRENFTKAHEVGHWVLHIDHSILKTNPLPGFIRPYEIICRSDSEDWDEKNADKFASYLLMPKELIIKEGTEFNNWNDIYNIAEKFNVSATAMKIRLENLGYLFVDNIGKFYKSREESFGQEKLI